LPTGLNNPVKWNKTETLYRNSAGKSLKIPFFSIGEKGDLLQIEKKMNVLRFSNHYSMIEQLIILFS